ncbi:Neurotransmitter-gated ion-channel ligand binding domain protein [Cooperia oncophora]
MENIKPRPRIMCVHGPRDECSGFVSEHARVSTVSMKIFLQQLLNVDEQNQLIEVNAWLKYTWNDYRLRWRPLLHDNISSLRFPTEEQQIWLPDILLYNSANENFDSSCRSNLVVYSNGEVNWIPPGIFKISCKMDITMFPFDEQVCFLKIWLMDISWFCFGPSHRFYG